MRDHAAGQFVSEREWRHRATSLELVDAVSTQWTSAPNASTISQLARSWWRQLSSTCAGIASIS